MKKFIFPLVPAAVLFAAALQLAAQQAPDPPALLRIFREDIKEGKDSAHERTEAAFMQEAARAKYPANVIGMNSITGPSQAWFLEAHDSFDNIGNTLAAFNKPGAEFAKLDEADAESRLSSRSWIAVYRPDLSYHGPVLMQNLPKARFFNITIVHVQNGHDQDFADLGHMAVDAAQKAINDQPVVVYQVVSGMAGGTFLLLEPSVSLKALDGAAERSRAMLQAMGDSGSKRFLKAAADSIASEESLLFGINSKMSYVSKEFAAGDPGFWNPPAEETKAPEKSGTKSGKKTASK